MQKNAFNIYNASAGSGKTFTLVKEYLKIILATEGRRRFQQILAVTFTNKAVNEMKQRILESLAEMGNISEEGQESELAEILLRELNTDRNVLQNRAVANLQRILHNYAFFDISTIDKFTHRVIRNFAKDLKISHNFEVVIDTDMLLDEAVDNLLGKSGANDELSRNLIAFSLEKTDADKHWDLKSDLVQVGKMLFQENELPHLKTLKDKTIDQFKTLQSHLAGDIEKINDSVRSKADSVIKLIEHEGFQDEDFPRQTLPKHFKSIRNGANNPDLLYNNSLEKQLQEGKILKSAVKAPSANFIESVNLAFLDLKSLLYKGAYKKNLYQNLLPLSILNAIYSEIKIIEKEKELLPISSFNSIISDIIVNQPAPFIYERLGEKYRHYFIDEFQDTSQMQWNNLVPLVANALEGLDEGGQPGSLMIVGDVKQAIYRWRGGKPEQFLNLIDQKDNPFMIAPEVHTLDINYRSTEEIIQFNNAFFKATSSFMGDTSYQRLFSEETQQKSNHKKGGYVQLEFIDKGDESLDESYLESICKAIDQTLKQGYAHSDICILTRKRKQGVLISQGLANLGIPVTSSETLLLKSSSKVLFLINLLKVAHFQEDMDARFNLLSYLIPRGKTFHTQISKGMEDLGTWLLETWQFNLEAFTFRSVYDGLEEAIHTFELVDESDAFITYLLDEVLAVEQRFESSMSAFLEYWEKNKEKLSITAPANLQAVKIMTIHKAKGLEFPIVIYPYANSDIYAEINPKIWVQTDPDQFKGFSELLVNKKKQLLNYGEEICQLYKEDLHKQELDAFNILYVALTRAIDTLYIISEKDLNREGIHKTNKYSGLFIHYLMQCGAWESGVDCYSFGTQTMKSTKQVPLTTQERIGYVYSSKPEFASKLTVRGPAMWDKERVAAVEKGTLIHYIMSLIEHGTDMEKVFGLLVENGTINSKEKEELENLVFQIISHPELKSYYQEDSQAKNEQEIITENGLILRPDRMVFREDRVIVIDYKTGARTVKNQEQVRSYSLALEQMGYTVEKGILVYINETINTEFIK